MTISKLFGAAALAGSLALATNAVADTAPDIRGVWSGTHTVAGLPNANSDGAPRFNEAELILDIKEQQGNAFWGTSKWSRVGSDRWGEAQVTGAITQDGSGNIAIVESRVGPKNMVNGLINATYEDGKIYADFRSMTSGISYSTVLERDGTS
ncbi:MAG: hypothetical protein AAF503_09965 [Pseudomonadota bacterium]